MFVDGTVLPVALQLRLETNVVYFFLLQLAYFQLFGNYVVEVGPRRRSVADPLPNPVVPLLEGQMMMTYGQAVDLVGRTPGLVFIEPGTRRVFAAGGQVPAGPPQRSMDAIQEDQPMGPVATGPQWSGGNLVQLSYEDLLRSPFSAAPVSSSPSSAVAATIANTQPAPVPPFQLVRNPFVAPSQQVAAGSLPPPSSGKKMAPTHGRQQKSLPPKAMVKSSWKPPVDKTPASQPASSGQSSQQAAGSIEPSQPAKKTRHSDTMTTASMARSSLEQSKPSASSTSRSWSSRSANSSVHDRSGGRRRPWTSRYGVRVTYDCKVPLMEVTPRPRQPPRDVREVAVQAVPTTRCRLVSACQVGDVGEPEPQRPLLQLEPPPKTTHRCSDKQLRLQKWVPKPQPEPVPAAVVEVATAAGGLPPGTPFLDVLRAELLARGLLGSGVGPGTALAAILADVSLLLEPPLVADASFQPAPVQEDVSMVVDPVTAVEVLPASSVVVVPALPAPVMDVDPAPATAVLPALEVVVCEMVDRLLETALDVASSSPSDGGVGDQDLMDEALSPVSGKDALQ